MKLISHGKFSERIAAHIQPMLPGGSSILVGLSGGLDSVVLLHLLRQFAHRFSWQLSAMHIHHGISPHADAWAAFCTDLCDRCGVPLRVERVEIAPLRDHGIEAAARKLRHQAFSAHQCDFVALAHHADDQAETLLLQLLRGAGVRGAASMPVLSAPGGSPAYVRPLLHQARSEILRYAVDNGLQWIDDESNADDYYPRNFLRHRVLPGLAEKFPSYRETLTRSSRHFAEASQLMDELALIDAQTAMDGNRLQLAVLRRLSFPRAKNLFRYFLHSRHVPMPQLAPLTELLRQLLNARRDANVNVRVGDYQIRRYMDSAYILPAETGFERDFLQTWNGEEFLPWPPQGTRLHFARVTGVGVSEHKLHGNTLTVGLRRGNETLRPHPLAARRTLKNLLQQHGIPPWQRERMPLIYSGEKLVCVVGVAVEADYQAQPGEPGLLVSSD